MKTVVLVLKTEPTDYQALKNTFNRSTLFALISRRNEKGKSQLAELWYEPVKPYTKQTTNFLGQEMTNTFDIY
jgi:hypothetical protein